MNLNPCGPRLVVVLEVDDDVVVTGVVVVVVTFGSVGPPPHAASAEAATVMHALRAQRVRTFHSASVIVEAMKRSPLNRN
jgi:hypothetical protein